MSSPSHPAAVAASARDECLICGAATDYYFSKNYGTYPGSPFPDQTRIDYRRCRDCGFVVSRTHQQMAPDLWAALNTSWHHHYENNLEDKVSNAPPYAQQALAIAMLAREGIVRMENALDYAAGYGSLAKFLARYFDIRLQIYDRYVNDQLTGLDYLSEAQLGRHGLVINSAMFEHVLTRRALDEVNDLVADDGVLMLHTVICDRIPPDPDWFYLGPMVHTAFHTNASMARLMQQWGYRSSLYSAAAKAWFLFKDRHPKLGQIEATAAAINRANRTTLFHYKDGFVDYWKGF